MSKQPKKVGKPKEPTPVLYLRLDEETEAALRAYIAAQEVPPDRTAVGITAVRQFLSKHGFLPKRGEG